jgi:hypothetical protein
VTNDPVSIIAAIALSHLISCALFTGTITVKPSSSNLLRTPAPVSKVIPAGIKNAIFTQ